MSDRPTTAKPERQKSKEPLLPTNSTPFVFTCRCRNLKVNGRLPASDEDDVKKPSNGESSKKIRVYLPTGSEVVKLTGYVTFDQDEFRPTNGASGDNEAVGDDTLGPSWRKCWLCEVKCYRAEGKTKGDPAANEEWVLVEVGDGIIYGDKLDEDPEQTALPFSGLRLSKPSESSNFGRPPSTSTPSLYPSSPDSKDPQHLIPPPHDPFFLPPPFIPSHPHLRDLCNGAGEYLREAHGRLEDDVRRYIAAKAQEMRDLEEKVRGEVEMLWEKYAAGPGKGEEETKRGRSTSSSRQGNFSRPISKERVEPTNEPSNNPIMKAATSPTSNAMPPGTSLLAQSLSANTFYAPAPARHTPSSVKDEISKTLDEVANTYGKKGDDRAVAMSYVLSTLGEHMGGSTSASGTSQARRRSSSASASNGNVPQDKDSWIDEERATLRAGAATTSGPVNGRMSAVQEEEAENRTPRPPPTKQLQPESKKEGERSKGKGKVTFEEPSKKGTAKEDIKAEEEEFPEVEDTVFDMEMDDATVPVPRRQEPEASPKGGLAHLPISRTRNMVEANLSHTFAADAPSHRAAWRRIEENGSMYGTLRRGSSSSDDEVETVDESSISKLAMSMPMAIHLPKSRTKEVPEFERKTSLSERKGVLVPPLLKAMRERGVPQANSLGLTPSRGRSSIDDGLRKTSRSASVSREREQVKSYSQDPGAVFESLADDGEEDEGAEEEEEEEQGTLRDNKGFVPPHVLARKNDKQQQPDLGWRSMVSE
ncbi:hypothetical protein I317_03467 [Kwoniella heveanensis CBS 569]|nr:hypothetical protein I317_03467 [Kwoniella heveanensis CBS 569]